MIIGGSNGYAATAGYNLVTGLGTPVAALLVSDLAAYHGFATQYSGPKVAPLQDAGLVLTAPGENAPSEIFSVFDSIISTHAAPSSITRAASLNHAMGHDRVGQTQTPRHVAAAFVDHAMRALQGEAAQETLIGDLAFEQVSSTFQKPRRAIAVQCDNGTATAQHSSGVSVPKRAALAPKPGTVATPIYFGFFDR